MVETRIRILRLLQSRQNFARSQAGIIWLYPAAPIHLPGGLRQTPLSCFRADALDHVPSQTVNHDGSSGKQQLEQANKKIKKDNTLINDGAYALLHILSRNVQDCLTLLDIQSNKNLKLCSGIIRRLPIATLMHIYIRTHTHTHTHAYTHTLPYPIQTEYHLFNVSSHIYIIIHVYI